MNENNEAYTASKPDKNCRQCQCFLVILRLLLITFSLKVQDHSD